MRYSVLLPPKDSDIWTILDDRDETVFAGLYQQCEEWLDLADLRVMSRGQSSANATENAMIRWPVYEQATALLKGLWSDCAGEVRVPRESQAIFLMTAAMICWSWLFVLPAVAQQMSLIQGGSTVACGSRPAWAGSNGEPSCAGSWTIDIACDFADDSY